MIVINSLKKYLTLIVLNLFTSFLLGQVPSVWTFGLNAGINFNFEPPQFFTSSIKTWSGSATLCDSTGALLLYSDGRKVYNSNGEIIKNGESINGFIPGIQCVAFLPSFTDKNEYYLFTIFLDYTRDTGGIYYSVINKKNEFIVTQKNILLKKGLFHYLTIVKHANNKDFWLITQLLPDSFISIRFSKNVVDTLIKSPNDVNKGIKPKSLRGNLKSSNDGRMLIECSWSSTGVDSTMDFSRIVLYKFNNETGIVSFDKIIDWVNNWRKEQIRHEYNDVAFSPNDSLFYVSDKGVMYPLQCPLLQFERFGKDVFSSKKEIKSCRGVGAVQLAPNGKIYALSFQYSDVSIINHPDLYGYACDPKVNIFKLSNSNWNWGTFPNVFERYIPLKFIYLQKECGSEIIFLNKSDTLKFKTFIWYFPNGDSFKGKSISWKFQKSGKYYFRLRGITHDGYNQWFSDTVVAIKKPQANLRCESSTGCQWAVFKLFDNSNTDTFNQFTPQSWQWNFGDGYMSYMQNPVHIYEKSGNYNITLIYSNGFCYDTIIKKQFVEILEAAKPGFSVNSSNNCVPFLLSIEDTSTGKVNNWRYYISDGRIDSNQNPKILFTKPGIYKIVQKLSNSTICFSTDSQFINLRNGFNGTEQLNIYTANVINNNNIIVSWKPNSFATTYKLTRTDESGHLEKHIINDTIFNDTSVIANKEIYQYFIEGLDSCEKPTGKSRLVKNILLTGESFKNEYSIIKWSAFEQWKHGVQEYKIEIKDSLGNFNSLNILGTTKDNKFKDYYFAEDPVGTEKCYRITAIENDGNKQQSVSNIICIPFHAIIWLPNAFTPNGDGVNDIFKPLGLQIKFITLVIYNRWGGKMFEDSGDINNLGWNGMYKNIPVSEGTYYYEIIGRTFNNAILYYNGVVNLLR